MVPEWHTAVLGNPARGQGPRQKRFLSGRVRIKEREFGAQCSSGAKPEPEWGEDQGRGP